MTDVTAVDLGEIGDIERVELFEVPQLRLEIVQVLTKLAAAVVNFPGVVSSHINERINSFRIIGNQLKAGFFFVDHIRISLSLYEQ